MSAVPDQCIHPLHIQGSAFFVGGRPVIGGWRLWVARRVYFWLGVSDVEGKSICTDKKLAAKMASVPGGFFMELPVNASLPEEPCQYGLHSFPSAEPNDYPHRLLRLVAVTRADMGPPAPGSNQVGCWQRLWGWWECFRPKGRTVTGNEEQSTSEGLLRCLGQWVREAKRDAANFNHRLEKIERELAAQQARRNARPHADD